MPQAESFKKRIVIGKQRDNENWVDDYAMDDTAIVYKNLSLKEVRIGLEYRVI